MVGIRLAGLAPFIGKEITTGNCDITSIGRPRITIPVLGDESPLHYMTQAIPQRGARARSKIAGILPQIAPKLASIAFWVRMPLMRMP